MRFYTALIHEEKDIFISLDGGRRLYRQAAFGWDFEDMNALIGKVTPEQLALAKAGLPEGAKAPAYGIADVTLLAPIEYPLGDVLCLGINYRDHATEAARFSKEAFGQERSYMTYFSKHMSRASGTGEPIPSYEGYVEGLDYEAELGVILGRTAKGVSREAAHDYIFGYTVINDVSARNLQTRHHQWLIGKSLDGFLPMGPCIVTQDELGDEQALNIRCYVNGQIRQDSNTRYMIQDVAGAIEELSTGITLRPGTIISTGTPSGVGMGMNPPGFLKKGDVVTCEVEGIGSISNRVE